MKCSFIILALFIGFFTIPPLPAKSIDSERNIRESGKTLFERIMNTIHHVQVSMFHVKGVVPEKYSTLHENVDEILEGLLKFTNKLLKTQMLYNENIFYGFNMLDSLTELSGGLKFSTVLEMMSLADKAHKVMEDAKGFMPHLNEELAKIQSKVESHVHEFAKHVVKELGLVSYSVTDRVENLIHIIEDKAYSFILDIVHKIEKTFEIMEIELPAEYHKASDKIHEIRIEIHELIAEVENSLAFKSGSLLEYLGKGGTSLSTVFKVISLVDKYNKVVQDVKTFEPRAEDVLQDCIKKVAISAQDFFTHAAEKLLSS